MKVIISEKAGKQINRFKYLTEYEVEEFILREIESEEFVDFLESCNSSICNEFYDKENKVTIFSEIDFNHEELTVIEVRRGNLVGKDFF